MHGCWMNKKIRRRFSGGFSPIKLCKAEYDSDLIQIRFIS